MSGEYQTLLEFVALSFGMCAALVPPHAFSLPGDFVGIGNVRDSKCEMFFIGSSSNGETITVQGHAVVIYDWDNGLIVTVDGMRFLVPRNQPL
jgi:hypothetical protein